MSTRYGTAVDPTAINNPHAYAISMVGSGGRVLEVGCSVGHVTEHLVAAGNVVIGIEVDAEAAEQARRFATQVHVADLDRTRLTDIVEPGFDVVLFGDVLEHLREPERALADAVSLLGPDGRVVISVPHVGFVDVRLMLLEGRWEYQPEGLLDRTHLRWFTRAGLAELLAGAHLTATRIERVRGAAYESGLPATPGRHGAEVLRFVLADPEATTYQFVLEARRAKPGEQPFPAEPTPAWPDLDGERAQLDEQIAALTEERDALRNEVDAWRRSRLVRLTAPLRKLRSRLR
ncbi:MAG TPA: methyltransferase domain-containing protein [Ilumatobacter sp.]|nr:methyltransferase domain-containing protein [Ilumatobacter sp.]